MALNETSPAYEAEAAVSHGQEDQGDLVVVGGRLGAIQKDESLRNMLEIGKVAGRIQAAEIIAHVSDAIRVGQIRNLKEGHKAAGLTWAEACKIAGISTQHADRILRVGEALGDDFIAHSERLGLSFRTLEAARRLPEDVRQALASGQVVDLEGVTKEALTDAIGQLAREHGKEKEGLDKELKAATKARDKNLDRALELKDEVNALTQEVEALKEGLSGDDKRDLDRLRQVESTVMAFMVSVKNTLEVKGRDPGFMARLFGFLSLLQNMADLTASVLQARLDGPEAEMAFYQGEAAQAQEAMTRQDNEDNAHFDKRGAYPGV